MKCAVKDLDLRAITALNQLGPFGQKNPKPKFWIRDVKPERMKLLGAEQKHLSFWVKNEETGRTVKCLWWSGAEYMNQLRTGRFDLVVRPELNRWQERTSVQFVIQDALALD